MTTKTIAALVAAMSLLALAACGGGGSGDSPQINMSGQLQPPPAPQAPVLTVDRVQTANPGATTSAAEQAANNLPAFGSVTQSSNGGSVSGITTDAASTSFDGSNVQLTVRREDSSSLHLDSATHRVGSSSEASSIPGHSTIRGDVLLDYTNASASIAVVFTSWDNDDPTDYLAGGYWIHATGDFGAFAVANIELGAFVDGPEIDGPPTLPISGSATYQGPTQGLYAQLWGTDDLPVPQGSTEIGLFAATVDLTADFGANTISGCVGCTGSIDTAGVFTNASTGEVLETSDTSEIEVRLGPASLNSDGSFRNSPVSVSAPNVTVTQTTGSWGGKFSNSQDAAGDPRLIAGTYGGHAVTSGETELVFVGAYYGLKQ